MSEQIKDALVTVVDTLAKSFKDEIRQSEPYKNMFGKSEGVNFQDALREAEHRMGMIALELLQVIEDKLGRNVNSEVFDMLQALPFLERKMERIISKEEGHVCCIDKFYFLLNKEINKPVEAKEATCQQSK